MKESSNNSSDDDNDVNTMTKAFLLKVGTTVYETTQQELTGRDEDTNWFGAQLSGRWKNVRRDDHDLLVPSRDGSLFYYVLFYLRYGSLPEHKDEDGFHVVALGQYSLEELQEEAEYFGLWTLAALCQKELGRFEQVQAFGDFDASAYTHLELNWKRTLDGDGAVLYRMHYEYNFQTVQVIFLATSNDMKVTEVSVDHQRIMTENDVIRLFNECRAVIRSGKLETVTQVLEKVEAPTSPAAQLWLAFSVQILLQKLSHRELTKRTWKLCRGS